MTHTSSRSEITHLMFMSHAILGKRPRRKSSSWPLDTEIYCHKYKTFHEIFILLFCSVFISISVIINDINKQFVAVLQGSRSSRKERAIPHIFQASQRGKPVGSAWELSVGALQPFQHTREDMPVWELLVFCQPGWKPVSCHHSNERGT